MNTAQLTHNSEEQDTDVLLEVSWVEEGLISTTVHFRDGSSMLVVEQLLPLQLEGE
jgi:hypothetical protein